MKPSPEMFEMFLKNKNLRERTIKDYMYLFHRFVFPKFNQHSVSLFLAEVKTTCKRAFINNYKEFLLDNKLTLGLDEEYIDEIQSVKLVSTGRKEIKLVKPLSKEEISILERELPTEELKIMLMLSYASGLRLNELMSITTNSFNWKVWKEKPYSNGECIVYGKGGKEGIALVPPELMKRIAKYIRSPESRIRHTDQRIFKMSDRSWQLKLKQAGIDSGITKRTERGELLEGTIVHPHRLRHSLGGNLIKSGMDIRNIQEILRHSSIISTQIYTRIDKEDLKKQYSKYAPETIQLREKPNIPSIKWFKGF